MQRIDAVNYHVWRTCNMHCKFCFATYDSVSGFDRRTSLSRSDSVDLVKMLAASGFRKITFAGGEPTLCPWLDLLIQTAAEAGMVTGLVTNGSLLGCSRIGTLAAYLDWLALSVDAPDAETNINQGRALADGTVVSLDHLKELSEACHRNGIRLKMNTVVTRANWDRDLSNLVRLVQPERWKIMQVLRISGENDQHFQSLAVSSSEFEHFVSRHSTIDGVEIVPEDNSDMLGTYVMVDPFGRFLDNTDGTYSPGPSILKLGVDRALAGVGLDYDGFIKRKGVYDW